MDINDRVKAVRNQLELTQVEFGSKTGISQGHLTSIENGKRTVTEKTLKVICATFDVNEEWLRFGQGEMFVRDDSKLITQLARQYNLDAFSRRFIETYVELPEAQRAIIKKFAYSVVAGNADVEISSELLPPDQGHKLTESDIDAEVESYRRELEVEKSIQTSSASHDGEKIG